MRDEEKTSKAVAAKRLDDFGLAEKKPDVPDPYRSGYGYGSNYGVGANSYGAAKSGGYAPPKFLQKDQSARMAGSTSASTPSDAGATRKHIGERTAQYAPHSYITSEEKYSVGERLKFDEAAVFSEASAKFIVNRVHEAMADALERYGLAWTSGVALNMKAQIRDSLEGCCYGKRLEDGSKAYVAVRVQDNEIDR